MDVTDGGKHCDETVSRNHDPKDARIIALEAELARVREERDVNQKWMDENVYGFPLGQWMERAKKAEAERDQWRDENESNIRRAEDATVERAKLRAALDETRAANAEKEIALLDMVKALGLSTEESNALLAKKGWARVVADRYSCALAALEQAIQIAGNLNVEVQGCDACDAECNVLYLHGKSAEFMEKLPQSPGPAPSPCRECGGFSPCGNYTGSCQCALFAPEPSPSAVKEEPKAHGTSDCYAVAASLCGKHGLNEAAYFLYSWANSLSSQEGAKP